jgi:hypothetical protein
MISNLSGVGMDRVDLFAPERAGVGVGRGVGWRVCDCLVLEKASPPIRLEE